jgi:hypothetical protein
MGMHKRSIEELGRQVALPLSSQVSRRTFLAGAAACAAVGSTLLRAAICEPGQQALLHVATRDASDNAYVHTFALTSSGCTLLGSRSVDSLAAIAAHPALPVLYVARDCRQWENLPRGVIESYAVAYDMRPLRLLSRSPMALSSTGRLADDIFWLRHLPVARGMPLRSVAVYPRPSLSLVRRRELYRMYLPSHCQLRMG